MEIIEQTHGPSVNEGHLGGFSLGGDGGTYYPIMWKYLIDTFHIKSTVDVGCGRGYASKFFKSLGCSVLGIDGANQAKDLFLLDKEREFVQHDFSKGPLIMNRDFDLAWTCEFVEHVEEEYIPNFMPCIFSAKYLAMTFATPGQGGHHHVNENTSEYWISKMKEFGFSFDPEVTQQLREKAVLDAEERRKNSNCLFFISHFSERGLFFKNDSK